nr:hypothetical protein [Tanacetum cinerariifolium]
MVVSVGWLWWCRGSGVASVVVSCQWGGFGGGGGCGVVEKRRVRESGIDERVDRKTSSLFGFAGKIPPEKFSGGGVKVVGVGGSGGFYGGGGAWSGGSKGWGRRVRESGVEGRIDRETRILFGFAGKIQPEKSPAAAAWWLR